MNERFVMKQGLSEKSRAFKMDVRLSFSRALLKRIDDTIEELLCLRPVASSLPVFNSIERITPDELLFELSIGLSIVKQITPEDAVTRTTYEADRSMIETLEVFDIACNFVIEVVVDIMH